MYLTFESSDNQGTVKDTSGKKNNAKLSKGATVSQRVLGKQNKLYMSSTNFIIIIMSNG